MVDCGSTSNDAIDFLNDNKIKSIVVDHHEISKPFPKANCIINPKKDNELIEYNYLCATALVYFFVDLLTTKIKSRMNIQHYLIYVLLATVCDVMPLRKLNRVIALQVLENFKVDSINFCPPNPGFTLIIKTRSIISKMGTTLFIEVSGFKDIPTFLL